MALVRVRRALGNVMDGSVGFQQFFLMYAKLITGLSDSKITVINTGNPSLEVLDWAIKLIC